MSEDGQANVQLYDSYFQEEDGKASFQEGEQVGDLEDGDDEVTESAGSGDEVKKGASLFGQLKGLAESWVYPFEVRCACCEEMRVCNNKL